MLVRYPTRAFIDALSSETVTCRLLEETFRSHVDSYSLDIPLQNFTAGTLSSGKQWLIEAKQPSSSSLKRGLLHMHNSYIYESNLSNDTIFKRIQDFRSALPPGLFDKKESTQITDKPLILLTTHNNPNYFHWMTAPGTSPLFLAEYFSVPLLEDTQIAISTRPTSASIAYPAEIVSLLSPNLQLVNSFFSTSTTQSTFAIHELRTSVVVNPKHIRWLRSKLRVCLKPSRNTHKRLLVSRQSAKSRRCLNEKSLSKSLSRYGFELVKLELLSVQDQLQLFSEAEIIISPHGAALANIVACNDKASVIEVLPHPGPFHHYYMMSDTLSLRHGHLLADKYIPETGDFYVTSDALLKLMYAMNIL